MVIFWVDIRNYDFDIYFGNVSWGHEPWQRKSNFLWLKKSYRLNVPNAVYSL